MSDEQVLGASVERIGRYVIQQELGRGAMGKVYLASDPLLGRDVAIKVIDTGQLGKQEQVLELLRRFDMEPKVTAQLKHPGIVMVHDFGESNGQKFIVMEYVKGDTLLKEMECGALPLPRALDVLHQVAGALDFAHAKRVVHRDIKPSNVVLSPDGVAKVLDFGAAKITVAEGGDPSSLIVGTIPYMSPEQLNGVEAAPTMDQWSLAVTAYEMLTGQKPFVNSNGAPPIPMICEGYPPSNWTAPPLPLPTRPELVFRQALAKSLPRFPNCSEFVAALAASYASPAPPQTPVAAEDPLADANRKYSAGDYAGAAQLLQSAAEAGNAHAMYNLGQLYEDGSGIGQNLKLAMSWYLHSANAGVAEAMNRLGRLFERNGDRKLSVQWYRKAAIAGNQNAAKNLTRLGLPVPEGPAIT